MNYNKVIKNLKERNDKLQEQYRLRDIRCIHLEYENEMLKSDFEAQHELTKKYAEENKQLKIQISAREEVCNRLESNWNKLKKYLNYKSERAVGEDEYIYDEIYNEMQEMDKNYGNVEDNT